MSISTAPGESNPDDGITVEEADETGVLTGEFDALLTGPDSAAENDEGCLEVKFTLTNVGSSADSYRVSSGDTVAVIDSTEISLGAGDSQELTVTVCNPSQSLVVEVYSSGLDDVVARLDI